MNVWIKTHFIIFFSLLTSSIVSQEEGSDLSIAEESSDLSIAIGAKPSLKLTPAEGYTINYNTVSIIEYIKFASKICNTNFIFNEQDLGFTVTVVSDAPITKENVMATLLQVLQIHGLTLLEQNNNLVIHKGAEIGQIATLVTENNQARNAPIVTRIFRVKNTKPDAIAAIIRPMISSSALLEVSLETRQIILTDLTANVDKVASLIEILDSPHTPLEIKIFETTLNTPQYLIDLCTKIMTPIAQGNPFILVPQILANQIFIISSPDLVAKALDLLKILDTAPKKEVASQRKLGNENMFVYKVEHQHSSEILTSLQHIATTLKKTGIPEGDLIETIETAKPIQETNSIMFLGSQEAIVKLKEFLTSLDVPSKSRTEKDSFFVYRPHTKSVKEIQKAIQEMASNLKSSKGSNLSLIETIEEAKINSATNTIIFSGDEKNFSQIKSLLATIDEPATKAATTASSTARSNFFIYKIQSASFDQLEASLKNFAKHLDKSNISDEGLIEAVDQMKYIKETNSILFTGSDASLKKLQEIVPNFDAGINVIPSSNQFFVYKPKNQRGDQIAEAIKEMTENFKSDNLADPAFVRTLQSMKFVKSTNSFLFTGDAASIKKLEALMATIDISGYVSTEKNIFLFHPEHNSREKTENYLKTLSENMNKTSDKELIEAIKSMKWIEASHSFVFQVSGSASSKLKEILTSFDNVDTGVHARAPSDQFFIYKVKNQNKGDQIAEAIKEMTENFKADNLADPAFVRTLQSMKFVKSTNSFLFTGDAASIKKLEALMTTIDTSSNVAAEKSIFLFHPEHTPREKIENYLKTLSENMNKTSDRDLIEAIASMKWIEASRSFVFQASGAASSRLKEILTDFESHAKTGSEKKYYIYKVQNTTGDLIEDDLEKLAKNFKTSGLKDHNVLQVIQNIRYVKETNSLLLTGDTAAIEEVKTIIAGYDYPRTDLEPVNTNFFMYKPQHQTATQITASLKEIGHNLQQANLVDPPLLTAIGSAKYSETTNSLIFTGNPQTLQKIQTLIQDIDIPPQNHAPIQHFGKTTFLLYKLKNAGSTQIVTSIKSMTANLKKSGDGDKDFVAALTSMKYIPETNSLLFTGKEEALTKVQELINQFDVSSLSGKSKEQAPKEQPPAPSGQPNFLLYKPQSLAGPDLQRILNDFTENLRLSGLSDPDLFNCVASMRWVEQTHSLVFTSNPKTLEQVKELLQAFDVPSNLADGGNSASLDSSIQSIDNTNFLVYKLQFHKGDEIQGALRQIAKDLILASAQVNQGLLNSINSIQWLEVTNSLLCSGDQETLPRLKELIKNLDIPLKQVFIEMLVIETSLINTLNFGLEWGGNYKYKNSFAGSMFNTPPTSAQDSFVNYLSQLNPPTAPTPVTNSSGTTGIAPPGGFDLGVIGEVIKHNGQTFLTLGSLLTALQIDGETSVIMTPKIITQDGRTSSIFVGQNVPFAGSFVSNTTTTTLQTTNIEYRDIGLSLTITPVLGNSDVVTLDINLDRSTQVANAAGDTISTGQNSATVRGITTSRTTMQTTVHVPDKNFLILSGFVNNSSQKTRTGIPCLGGLPVIGAAFSKDSDSNSNSNIVIFLRPRIITSLDEMRRMTSDQEDFFRDQASTPFLEHNYEEGIELIKTVDDE